MRGLSQSRTGNEAGGHSLAKGALVARFEVAAVHGSDAVEHQEDPGHEKPGHLQSAGKGNEESVRSSWFFTADREAPRAGDNAAFSHRHCHGQP